MITIAIIAQRLKILIEVNVKGNGKVAAAVCREVFRIGQHLVVTKGMLVGIVRVKVVVDIREEKFEAVRLSLVGQEAAMNRAENTGIRLFDIRFTSMEGKCYSRIPQFFELLNRFINKILILSSTEIL